MARHISADGCQFIVESSGISEGERLCFALDGHPAVRGTVRWVVANRVGFAFDTPISRDAQVALTQCCGMVQGVDLHWP